DRIKELEEQASGLLKWKAAMVETVFAQFEGLQEEIDKLSQAGASALPYEADENGHVIINDDSQRNIARRAALEVSAYPDGLTPVVRCDEQNCAAAEHLDLVSVGEARKFNAERVSNELASLNRGEVQFAIDCLTTPVGDGHRVPSDSSKYRLPSGRQISLLRATAWAFSRSTEVPGRVKRTCGRGDCVEYRHLTTA